jgi:hypothetical protein
VIRIDHVPGLPVITFHFANAVTPP